MGISINEILNSAKLSLTSQQIGIDVTGNNIANVNTPNYSRQRVVLEALKPRPDRYGAMGLGVQVSEIKRVFDSFLYSRINNESENFGRLNIKKSLIEQVEQVFTEDGETGLSTSMNEFWAAWHDVSSNPQSLSGRSVLLGKAEKMASLFNKMDSDLNTLRRDADKEIVDVVAEVNSLTERIAALNLDIGSLEVGNKNANDLRDRREGLIKELAGLVDVEFFETPDNMVNISTTGGRTLVIASTSLNLSTSVNTGNDQLHDVIWTDSGGNQSTITNIISGGKLNGLVSMRDSTILDIKDKTGRTAAGLINEVNKLHFNGYGLDGSTGLTFFDNPPIKVRPNTSNTGTGTLSSSLYDIQSFSRDNYEITITGSTQFSITNTTLNSSSGTYSFSSGSNVYLTQGFTANLSGSYQVGDVFALSGTYDAAKFMAINSNILNDEKKIAASSNGLQGDGNNALNIASLQDSLVMSRVNFSSGTFSFSIDDFYSSLVVEVGSEVRKTVSEFTQQEGVVSQIDKLRESISGVSLDEEMINLLKFQRAYQGAARVISTVDEILNTLLGM